MVESRMSIAFLARSSDVQLRPCSNPSTNSVLASDIQVSRSNGSMMQVMPIGVCRRGVVEMAVEAGWRTLLMAHDT